MRDRIVSWLWLGIVASGAPGLLAGDCNENGVDDFLELAVSRPELAEPATYTVLSRPAGRALPVDLNADGALDLAVPGFFAGGLAILQNRGDGTFEEPSILPGPMFCMGIIAGDLNGDGRTDIATSGVHVYLAGTSGSLGDPVALPADSAAGLASGDLDLDGDIDLVTAGSGGTVLRFLNDGAGTFASLPVEGALSGGPRPILLGDLDRNGIPDLVAFDSGTPEAHVRLGRPGNVLEALPPLAVEGPGFWGAVLVDLDGDEVPDLAAAGGSNVQVLLNDGEGRLGAATTYPVGTGPVVLVAADLDEDNALDLATANNGSGDVAVLRNRGDGRFRDAGHVATRALPSSLAAGDLDQDGDLDLATAFGGSGPPTILVNDGLGAFDTFDPELVVGGAIQVLAAFLDGNATPDLIYLTTRGASVLLNRTTSPGLLDLNRNGVPDTCEAGSFHRADANGDGALDLSDAVKILTVAFLGSGRLECLGAADANADTRVDLSDAVSIFTYLFLGGSKPPHPGPPGEPCGLAPGPLSCESYSGCNTP